MEEPRAHICVYVPEHNLEIHLDICAQPQDDILEVVASSLVQVVTQFRDQLTGHDPSPINSSITIN